MAGVSVVISATDRASGVFGKVNTGLDSFTRRIEASRAPMNRMASSLGRFAQATGLTRVAAGFTDISRRAIGAGESLGRFAPALAGITSAASIAGLARLVGTWTTFGSRLGLDAQRIGMSARNLQSLQGAARLAGSSAEALTSGMTTLGDNLTDAVGGRSPETIQMLSTLGIAFQDASGHARTAEAVLPQLADRIAAIKNPALQARAATALFGGAGEALLPFLRRGAAGIADYNAQASRYGLLNQAGVSTANAMREAQARLGLAVEGVGYSVSERLAPVLVPMLDRLSNWIGTHREEIAGFFGDVATRIERWVDSGGIDRVATAVTNFGTRMASIVDTVGGATTALEIFFGLWVGAKVIQALAAMARVTAALRGVGAARAVAAGGGAAMAEPGPGPRTAPRSGISALGMFGGPLGALALGADLAEGRTREEQRAFNEDTFIAKLGKALGEAIGMQFDEHGVAKGLLNHTPASSAATDLTPGERSRAALATRVPVADPSGPGGYRNNNPTNLAFYPGQRDVQGFNGRWGVYKDATAGTAAGVDQLLKDQDRGFNTVAAEIQRRSPPNENDTLGMIRDISKWAGMDPGATYNLRDPDQAKRLTSAIIRREQGRAPDPAMVDAAVNRSLGIAPAAPPVTPVPPPVAGAGSAGANGTATVRLEHVNPPAGLQTSVQTSGGVQYGGLRVERPQIGNLP